MKKYDLFPRSFAAVLVVLLFLGAVQFFYPPFFSPFVSLSATATKPIYRLSQRLKKRLVPQQSMLEENASLRDLLSRTVFDFNEYQKLKRENKQLKSILRFQEKFGFSAVNAAVEGTFLTDNKRFFIIDRGQSEGIYRGAPVTASEGFLAGIVVEAKKDYAVFSRIKDGTKPLSAKIRGREGDTIGLVEGAYQLSLEMAYIPKDAVVQKGDIVVTSGFDEGIPPDLVIGQVDKVIDDTSEFFKTAAVVPVVDLTSLQYVSVMTGTFPGR